MVKNFTQKNLSLIRLYSLSILLSSLSLLSFGQTTHQVEVKSNVYIPADITINAGDKIIWTNTGGNHNVNGTFEAYPDNPDFFGNDVAAAGWTYEFTFTMEGLYNYHCNPHLNFGMTGTVTVLGATSVEKENFKALSLYPNPVTNNLKVSNPDSDFKLKSIKIYSLTGSLKFQESYNGETETMLNLENFDSGYYLIKVESNSRIYNTKFIKK